MLFDPLLDPANGMVAGKMCQGFALAEENDSGESAHTVVSGKLHVFTFVHLEFGQFNCSIERFNGVVEMWRKSMTWTAPVGPEVNQHRKLKGAFDDLFIKLVQVNVIDVICVGQGDIRMKYEAVAGF